MKARQDKSIITMTAGEALTKNRFVDFEGKHTVDKKAVGTTIYDVDEGDPATIQCSNIAVVEAGGTITPGDLVKSDADGKALSLTLSAVSDVAKICGLALDRGTSGSFINVKLGG